jgi:alpha-tubulin suppressor-like RCC1 family protein
MKSHILLTFCSAFLGVWSSLPVSAAVVPSRIEAWGDNSFGQITIPAGLNDVIAISAGFLHNLALRSDGTVVAWGNNGQGQTSVPPGLSNVVAIAARVHSVALKADGTVVAWGGFSDVTNVPSGLTDVVAISAGASANGNAYTLALRRDGTIVAWGNVPTDLNIPPGLTNVIQISAGYTHSLALKNDRTIAGWAGYSHPAIEIPPGLSDVATVRAGQSTSFAIKTDGSIVKWGGSFDSNDVPAGVTGVVDLQLGHQHVVALGTNGTVLAWGYNGMGQTNVPPGLSGVGAVAAGGNHSLALTARPGINFITPPVTATVGATTTLTVSAVGEPLSYQWQHKGTNLPGRTNATLVIQRTLPTHSGTYSVIVTNPHGTITAFTSISLPPPTISAQPQNLTVYRGETVTFTVTPSGFAPFTYQWFKDGALIENATNAVFTFIPLDRSESGPYSVIVTDVAGGTVTSAEAQLTVIDPRPDSVLLRTALDTSIHSDSGNPRGTATILSGTRRNGFRDRGLLRFDFSVIPTNATIEFADVSLTLVMSPRVPAESNFQLHRALKPWTASAGWQNASETLLWSAPGGAPGLDYATNGTLGEYFFGSGEYRFFSADGILADVRAWNLDRASNHGWFIISDSEAAGGSARHFGSSESPNPPALFIRYSFPVPPTEITNVTRSGTNFQFQLNGAPGWIYNIQTREHIDRGAWTAFTNAPAGAALAPILITVPLTNRHQFFRTFRY